MLVIPFRTMDTQKRTVTNKRKKVRIIRLTLLSKNWNTNTYKNRESLREIEMASYSDC